jgi:uncharacterized protein (TIGR02217 family)
MAFLEQRLDPRITRGATGGPTNRGRTKNYTAGGALHQNFQWSAPLFRYDVSHGLKSQTDAEALLAMWHVVNFTPYEGFRFKDWADYQLSKTNSRLLFLTGSTWQIQRVYTSGATSTYRDIKKPLSGVVIYRTRSGVESTATATIDTTTGVATVSGHASGDTYTAVGEFDVPVTFAGDDWVAELEGTTANLSHIMPAIELEEVRLA